MKTIKAIRNNAIKSVVKMYPIILGADPVPTKVTVALLVSSKKSWLLKAIATVTGCLE